MATASSSETLAVAGWDHDDTKSDRYLAARLAAAGADFKGVAAVTFILAAAMAALVWLAVGVVAEHWVVPGGLSTAARWAWLVVGLFALGAALIRWILPLVRYRVNLLYAARVIEHEHPELLNDLVNAVLVKAHPEASSQLVVRALERRAAKRLSGVPADGVADRAIPLRLAVALATLVACLCLYQLFAPKSLAVSALRMVVPWLDVAAPARVSIAPLRLTWRVPPGGAGAQRPAQPLEAVAGTVTLVRGRQLVVETDITGLRAGERPILEVTPLHDDGTVEEAEAWQSPLAATAGPGRMTAVVPDAARGLERSVEFVVVAGDARSGRIRVAVVDTPTLLVREVRYDYPPYTGRAPETVAWEGDLRAPEFTKVTITAESNGPLEGAWIDPGCSGRDSEKKRMRVGQHDLSRAIGEFPLRLKADRTAPEFSSYRLVLQPKAAAGSREPPIPEKLEHRVEVIADLAPEVSIEAPAEGLHVPPSAPVAIQVRAVDPDYGLARVGVEMRIKGGRDLGKAWLLDRPHAGEFNGVHQIELERIGVAGGGVVEYRAVAEDTRPESPNKVESPWRTLTIDAAAPAPPLPPRQAPPSGGADSRPPQEGMPAAGPGASQEQSGGGEQPEDSDRRDNGGKGQSGEPQAGGGRGDDGDPKQAPGGGASRQDGRTVGAKSDGTNGGKGGKTLQGGEPRGDQQESGGQKGGQEQGGKEQAGKEQAGKERGGKEQGGKEQGGGDRTAPPEAVAADGSDDGAAMERILNTMSRTRGTVRQRQDQRGPITVEQELKGKVGDVTQGQAQNQQGEIDQEQNQQGPAATKQKLEGEVGDVDQQQAQNQQGRVEQAQSQKGPAAVEQELKGKVGDVAQGQAQNQQGEIDQEQNQQGPAATKQKLEGEVGDVDQQQVQNQQGRVEQAQSQKGPAAVDQELKGKVGDVAQGQAQNQQGEIDQEQNQQGPAATKQKLEGEVGDVDQQQAQNQQGRVDEAQTQKGPVAVEQELRSKLGDVEQDQAQSQACEKCDAPHVGGQGGAGSQQGQQEVSPAQRGQKQQGQANTAQSQQSQSQQSQAAVAQSQQGQSQQGQSLVDQRQQTQTQQGQTLVGQANQGQGQQFQSLVGQRQQGQVQQGQSIDDKPRPSGDVQWTEQDMAHARNAANLAIKHLRDDMNAGRGDVLDELGWTPAQARAFIERWESMQRLAAGGDEKKRGEFERALRSLGLRPDQVVTARDVPAAARGGQAQGRRGRPPAAYREQFEAYQRAAGTE